MQLSNLLLPAVAAMTGISANSPELQQRDPEVILFAGTSTEYPRYVNDSGQGIYTYKLNTTDGTLKAWATTPFGQNPTYLVGSTKPFNSGQRVIYVVNTVSEESISYPGTRCGYVSALTLANDGSLKLLNTLDTRGEEPAHISLSPDEKFAAVSNSMGSIALFPLNSDGSLARSTFFQEFPQGSGVADPQERGLVRSTAWLPISNHMVVSNFGLDELLQCELDEKNRSLKSLEAVHRPPGSGPRHMAFHPGGKFAYVVDELSNTVGVYAIDMTAALLSSEALQIITTLPADFIGKSSSADIHLSRNGKFLYTSNRGHDSIAMFKINQENGMITSLGFESSRGKYPCGFTIYGDWLIVSNLYSNDMYVFKVNSETGLLMYTGNAYEIGSPVSLYITEYSK